jgi:hypothetical protein
MRILVTISRDWDEEDFDVIWHALDEVCRYHKATVVHGASQMDFFVAGMARVLGMDTEPHFADWQQYRGAAGPIRNTEMVNLGADVCLAFIKGESTGATDCANKAQRAGIETKRYRR